MAFEEQQQFIAHAVEKLQMKPNALADACGISHEMFRKYRKGYAPLTRQSRRSIELIQMLRNQGGVTVIHDAKGKYDLRLAPAGKIVRTPVVSWARAGEGGNFGDLANQIDEWLEVESKDDNAYALIVEGDSMWPEIKPGDRVVVEPNRAAVNGSIVVARLDETGDVFIKVFHRSGETVRLTSYNSVYPPLEFPTKAFRFIHPVSEARRMLRR